MNRRHWIRCMGAMGVSWCAASSAFGAEGTGEGRTLSIGTYAMPTLPLEKAIAVVAACGYDGIEIAARTDYDGAPSTMPEARRRMVHQLLQESGLKLTALMATLYPNADDSEHAAHVEQLRRVGELANDLATGKKPVVQTTLGGGNWAEKKNLFRDRLGDWGEALRGVGIVLAIKPHRGGGMSRPEEAVWLIHQLTSAAR